MNELFEKLSQYKITLIRYDDQWRHWRLGLDWYSEDDYQYIVEKPTIQECLEFAVRFHEDTKF